MLSEREDQLTLKLVEILRHHAEMRPETRMMIDTIEVGINHAHEELLAQQALVGKSWDG